MAQGVVGMERGWVGAAWWERALGNGPWLRQGLGWWTWTRGNLDKLEGARRNWWRTAGEGRWATCMSGEGFVVCARENTRRKWVSNYGEGARQMYRGADVWNTPE